MNQPQANEDSRRVDAAEAVVSELAAFCEQHGAPCFVGWPENILREYLWFHAVNGSLLYVRDTTGAIAGLAVGWQCREQNIGRHWQTHDPKGTVFYFDNLVCSQPGALGRIVRAFRRRFPSWKSLKLHANRRHRGIIRYRRQFIDRLERL